MPAHYEVFEDKAGEFRWRLVAANGETVSQSEAYGSKSDFFCTRCRRPLRNDGARCPFKDTVSAQKRGREVVFTHDQCESGPVVAGR